MDRQIIDAKEKSTQYFTLLNAHSIKMIHNDLLLNYRSVPLLVLIRESSSWWQLTQRPSTDQYAEKVNWSTQAWMEQAYPTPPSKALGSSWIGSIEIITHSIVTAGTRPAQASAIQNPSVGVVESGCKILPLSERLLIFDSSERVRFRFL